MSDTSGMAHRPRRKKYDQERTPWIRLGPREAEILDAGWHHVRSVPYKVSLRWLFYRLLQDGFYKTKGDYKNNFGKLFSRARHTYQGGWRPDTLEDEGRDFVIRSGGCQCETDAFEVLKSLVLDAASVAFDHFYKQANYVELWYEANAMTSQFEHYTHAIDLVPMCGTASIPFKWKIAKRLEEAAARYGKPIRILYFGDADPAGHTIKDAIAKDVRRWCSAPFEIVWCGLTEEQAERHRIPESYEKRGYQWEAIPDEGARQIITSAVETYIDPELIDEADDEATAFSDEWRDKLEAAIDTLEQAE
jgi:hypothetical protein